MSEISRAAISELSDDRQPSGRESETGSARPSSLVPDRVMLSLSPGISRRAAELVHRNFCRDF